MNRSATKSQIFRENQVHIIPVHHDVMEWKHFPRYWPFVRGIHRSTLIFLLICVWINDGVNHQEAGDLRRHHAQYDVTIMPCEIQHVSFKLLIKMPSKLKCNTHQIPKLKCFLSRFVGCLCNIHWSYVLSWEWRCINRRCSNYIWMIKYFIVYYVWLILEVLGSSKNCNQRDPRSEDTVSNKVFTWVMFLNGIEYPYLQQW